MSKSQSDLLSKVFRVLFTTGKLLKRELTVLKNRHGYFANCTLRTRLGTIPVKIADSNLIENIEEKALANFNHCKQNERSDVNAAQKEKLYSDGNQATQ